jgi:hypothetical protein
MPWKRGHPVAEANDGMPLPFLKAASLLGEVSAELVRIHPPAVGSAVYAK